MVSRQRKQGAAAGHKQTRKGGEGWWPRGGGCGGGLLHTPANLFWNQSRSDIELGPCPQSIMVTLK